MGVSIEWIRPDVGIARSGKLHKKLGDPYTNVLVVDAQGEVVVFKGMVGEVLKHDWRAIEKLLAEKGFRFIARDVYRDGERVRRNVRDLRK